MKIARQSKKNRIIDVSSRFARLLAIRRRPRDGKVTNFFYEFTYTIDQIAAIRDDITAVKILVRRDPPEKEKSVWAQESAAQIIQPGLVVANIVKAATQVKDLKLANVASPIRQVALSIGNKFSAAIAKKVKLAKDEQEAESFLPKQKVVVSKLVSAVKKTNKLAPILKIATNTCIVAGIITEPQPVNFNGGDLQAASLNLILNKKVDPSDAHGVTTNVVSTQKSFAGVQAKPTSLALKTGPKFVTIQPKVLTPFANLIAKPTTPTSDDALFEDIEIPVIEVATERHVSAGRSVMLSADEIGDAATFHVEFKLLGRQGNVVATLGRFVQHRRILDNFETPRQQPVVKAAPIQIPGRNTIELTQLDEEAVSVKMYRRSVNRLTNVNDPVDMAYAFAGEIPVSVADGSAKIVDVINNTSTLIYRFIPVGLNGRIGTAFSNIIIPGTGKTLRKRRRVVNAAIDVETQGELATIRVTNLVKGPVAVGIQRRNKTIFERDFSFISDRPVVLTDNEEDIEFNDDTVKEDNIYEYRLILFFEDGSEELSTAYFIYEHIPGNQRGVEIIITDPEIKRVVSRSRRPGGISSQGASFDIQFGVTSRIDENDIDMIRTTLERQGLTGLYVDELKTGRDALSELIAHRVQRVNTADGSLEDFGVLTKDVFSDVDAGRTKATRPLRAGVKYRYLITTLLRSPETMFEDFTKTATSPQRLTGSSANPSNLTTQEYSFKPSKFLHPITLKRGTLTSSVSRKAQRARDEFTYGILGNTKAIEVIIPSLDVKLSTPQVQRVDSVTNIVRWEAIGDTTLVDYFLIIFNHLGTDQVVGKVHALNDTSTFEFFHDLDDVDVGTATYTIRTMLTNFRPGSVLTTESVII